MTVLFADLVGFTARAEQLDPEDVRGLLAPYHAHLRGELERFGGTVEKFIGDAVVALFGAPTAHEDDPERAVRAALAIRDWVTQEERAPAAGRRQHGRGADRARRPAGGGRGDGLGRRDQHRRPPAVGRAGNGILVGETTYRATKDVIDYREADSVDAKGKSEPVPAWEALEARSRVRASTWPRRRRRSSGASTSWACSATRSSGLARGTLAAARHPRGRPGHRQVAARRRALPGRWRRSPTSRRGARAARSRTAKASASGRSARSSRRRPGSSSRTRPRRWSAKLRAAVEQVRREPEEADWMTSRLGNLIGSGGADERRRRARRELLGLAAVPRSAGRPAPARARLRGPALGRRRPARLRRSARGLGARVAGAGALHGAARAARAQAGLGRGQGERDHDLAAAARGQRDGEALLVAARPGGAAGRDAVRSAGACGRQPALRRAVRADARRAGRRRRAAATRDGAGDHRRAAGRALGARRSRCCRTHRWSARCSGSERWGRSAASSAAQAETALSASSARSWCSGRGARPSRARPSTRSATCSCETSPTARSRAPPAWTSTWPPPIGSRRSAERTTRRRCSRTTTRPRSSTRGPPGERMPSSKRGQGSRFARPATGHALLCGLARGCSFLRRGARALAERRSGTPAAAFSPRSRTRGLCRRARASI